MRRFTILNRDLSLSRALERSILSKLIHCVDCSIHISSDRLRLFRNEYENGVSKSRSLLIKTNVMLHAVTTKWKKSDLQKTS